ncbi:MAG: folate-binding protein YgfZ [Actinobacteria bacterium]|nr:folate-binding protein YgfZ [Actinomycetota bacterium]
MLYRRSRDVVAVRGPDAEAYLQGQLSQDVAALADGASGWSFLLQPTGKVDAWLRVTRRGEGDYILDVDSGFGGAVQDRLRRFLLRTDCVVEALGWEVATLLQASPPDTPPGGVVIELDWPDLAAFDLVAPEVSVPAGLQVGDAGPWEEVRIRAGIPAMGSEIDENTIPNATGQVERSVSFTKGCYTGQELVARIDSRTAGAPTRLVRVDGTGEAPPVGAQLWSDGGQVGHLTSVVSTDGGFHALGYRKRSALEIDSAEAHWEGGRGSVVLRSA